MKKTILTIAFTAAFSSFITVGVINQIGGLAVEQKTAVKEVDGKFKTLKGSGSGLGGELAQMDEAAVAKAASKATKKPSAKKDSTKSLDNGNVFEWVDTYTGVHYLIYSLQREVTVESIVYMSNDEVVIDVTNLDEMAQQRVMDSVEKFVVPVRVEVFQAKMLHVPLRIYSESTFRSSPGRIGSGSLVSPNSWYGFSSIQTTGRIGSYASS